MLSATIDANLYPPRVFWRADDVMLPSFSGIAIVFSLFGFRFSAFIESAAVCSIVFRYACAVKATFYKQLFFIFVLFLEP